MVTLEDVRAKRRELRKAEEAQKILQQRVRSLSKELDQARLDLNASYSYVNDVQKEFEFIAVEFALNDEAEDAIPTVIPGMEDDIPF